MNNRLDTYFKQTQPIIDFYAKKGILYTSEVSTRINKMGADVAKELI